jgi:hypothetical protein
MTGIIAYALDEGWHVIDLLHRVDGQAVQQSRLVHAPVAVRGGVVAARLARGVELCGARASLGMRRRNEPTTNTTQQTNRQTNKQTNKQANKLTNRQTNKQTNKQTNRQNKMNKL